MRISRTIHFYSLVASIILSVIITSYAVQRAAISPSEIIGENFIDAEFPSPDVSPIYLKPVTWLTILAFVGWFSFIELIKKRISLLTYNARFVYSVLLFLITALSLYEISYNFTIWGSQLAASGDSMSNPDAAINKFPNDKYKVNLVFATKIGFMIFICGFYALVVMINTKEK